MCTGVEIAILGTMAAGTAVSAAGAIKSSEDQAAALEQQGEIARRQAQFAEARHRERSKSLLSRQRTAIAKAGVAIEGTPLEVMTKTAEDAELDALAIRYGGQTAQHAARIEARQVRTAGRYRAASNLLTGAGQTAYAGRRFKAGTVPDAGRPRNPSNPRY